MNFSISDQTILEDIQKQVQTKVQAQLKKIRFSTEDTTDEDYIQLNVYMNEWMKWGMSIEW